ncbi:MAG: phage tail protein [Anaerolineales bacterium]
MDNPNNPGMQQPSQQQPSYQQPAAPQPPPSHGQFSAQAQNPSNYGIRMVDSLSANEFHLEINGQIATGIFSVSGLTPFSLKVDENSKPVSVNFPPLVITKMVQQDPTLPFNAWVREAVEARGQTLPTREIAIVAMDEGIETRRWIYQNAWISEVTFSDFDTALDYLVEEKITLRYGAVVEVWPQR